MHASETRRGVIKATHAVKEGRCSQEGAMRGREEGRTENGRRGRWKGIERGNDHRLNIPYNKAVVVLTTDRRQPAVGPDTTKHELPCKIGGSIEL